MTDWHLLTTLKASSPAHSGTHANGHSDDTMDLSPNTVFPKGFRSMSSMTQHKVALLRLLTVKFLQK